jgi:hypothetical protein
MLRLVVMARERTGQYASLSWGVLSAVMRSIDHRDGRTARHSAAVATYARDIAIECEMRLGGEVDATAQRWAHVDFARPRSTYV